MNTTKPERLKRGDTVAIISPSWGGPSVFPTIYERGLQTLKEWGLKIKEYPTSRMDADKLYKNPETRAKDVNDAFTDREVNAIIASIGGDDSIRILPHLNLKTIMEHPKMFIGYSDTTTLTTLLNQQGLVTVNGPSIMAGLAQWNEMPKSYREHVYDMLFDPQETTEYPPLDEYSNGYPNWGDKKQLGKRKALQKTEGWRWLQGTGKTAGKLYGGCIEVLEFMNGTPFWPKEDFWDGKLLFLETSEEKPDPEAVKRIIRNLGIQGILDRINGILVGRARDYTTDENEKLYKNLVDVTRTEFKKKDLPIIANMDFGHTDPQYLIPLGIRAEIDTEQKTFRLLERPFT